MQKDYKFGMSWHRTSGALLLIALVLGASGCELKKKKPNVPQQAQAPTITTPTTTATTTTPGPPPPETSEPARPLPTPGEVATNVPPEQPAPKPERRPRRTPPKKTVVENTPPEQPPAQPAPPQQQQDTLTASVSHADALHDKLNTQQLLDTTENNLRSVTRSLSSDEQVMVAHIRSYMQQSKNATTDGDIERAYNLALKARLLSDELVKR